jgi:hypothetical protein
MVRKSFENPFRSRDNKIGALGMAAVIGFACYNVATMDSIPEKNSQDSPDTVLASSPFNTGVDIGKVLTISLARPGFSPEIEAFAVARRHDTDVDALTEIPVVVSSKPQPTS